MPEIIISDTTCLILLSNIGELNLLERLYNNIVTTPEVAKEYGDPLPSGIILEPAVDRQTQKILELQIDRGEASALALDLEKSNCLVILDDHKARMMAERLDLKITGTIGIIIKAKLSGLIPSIKPLLYKIRQTNFRLSVAIEAFALKEAGE